MRKSSLLASLVVAGCGASPSDSTPPPAADLAVVRHDLAVRPSPDLAFPFDLAAPGDDLSVELDDAGLPDLRMPRDLYGRDLATRDMARPDLARIVDMSRPDLARIVDLGGRDLAMPDAGPPPDLAQGDGGASCHPIVNELQAGTAASASIEFVELFNPCANDVALMGWSLSYRAAANLRAVDVVNDNNNLPFPNNAVIKSGAYFVACAAPFPGMCDWKYAMAGIMANGGGAVGLRGPGGLLENSVGYGTASPMNAFVQTAPAPAPPLKAAPGGSIGRLPNGTDTFDNSKDWKVTTMITPDAVNQ